MLNARYWRFGYGAVWACASAALVAALVLNARSIATQTIGKFDFDWAFGWGSLLDLGVIPLLVWWIILTALEQRFPVGPIKPASGWFLNLKVNLLGLVLDPLLGALLGVLLGYLSSRVGIGLIDLRVGKGTGLTKLLLSYLLWVFTIDFFYYWWHRFQHESFLWQQHKFHHLDEQVSAITALRVHWLENLVYVAMVTLPPSLLFRFDPATGGIVLSLMGVFTSLWQVFFHANLKIGFGWASPLFVSPQLHRIHHSRLSQHHDKNFAAYFPILDVIFGTYYHPGPDEYPPTGVTGESDVTSFRESLYYPLREWWKMLRAWHQQRSAVSA